VPSSTSILRTKGPHVTPSITEHERFYPGKLMGRRTDVRPLFITKQVVERCDSYRLPRGDLDESLPPLRVLGTYWQGDPRPYIKEMVSLWTRPHLIWRDRPRLSANSDTSTTPLRSRQTFHCRRSWVCRHVEADDVGSRRRDIQHQRALKMLRETLGSPRIRSGSTGSWMSWPTGLAFGTRL